MEEIIIFGTGNLYKKRIGLLDRSEFGVVELWDNDETKWGQSLDGVMISAPHKLEKKVKVIIATCFFDEIYKQLLEIGVNENNIFAVDWFEKMVLKKKYGNTSDEQINQIFEYLQDNNIQFINYLWTKEYNKKYEVFWDIEYERYYVIHNSKKMYMHKKFTTEEEVSTYYKSLLIEQDKRSPHYYGERKNYIGKYVIDLGAAEGNFSLDIIEVAKKIVIVEADDDWCEALKITFKDYNDKVEIINKFVGTIDDSNYIRLSDLIKSIVSEHEIIIKMDIEGNEEIVLEDSKKLLCELKKDSLVIACTYHHSGANDYIIELLGECGFDVHNTQGYMYFDTEYDQYIMQYKGLKNKVDLRKGIAVGVKK